MPLPKVGAQAVLELQAFERASKKYESILDDMKRKTDRWAKDTSKATKGVTDSFDEFTKSSQGMQDALNKLGASQSIQIFQDLREAFGELGKDAEINIDLFDKMVAGGESYTDAFAAATGATDTATFSLNQYTAALTIASTTLAAGLKIIRESVQEYTRFAEEVNKIRLELGSTATEASAWARAAETAGVSATTLNRAITSVEKNLVNMRLRQIEGKDASNNFTRALDALNISATEMDGSFKDGNEILREVQQRFQELGPGVITTGLALDIFGFSGRQLLPILLEEELALDRLEKRAKELGGTITEDDIKAFREWNAATKDLKTAKEALGNLIGRLFTPALTELAKVATVLVNEFRKLLAALIALEGVQLTNLLGITKISDSAKTYEENLARLLGTETELTAREQELAQDRNELAQETLLLAQAEEALVKERQKLIDQLAELDIKLGQRIADVNTRFDRQLEDLAISSARKQQEAAIRAGFKLEDIHIKRNQRLRELEFKWQGQMADVQADTARKIQDFERDAARARERIWVRHRENLIKIENRFADTVDEAARKNDTVAVVRAIRNRNRGLRDETRRFSVEQSELEKDLAIKRDKINEDAERKKQEQINRFAEEKARIERQFQDEIAALQRKQVRDKQLRDRSEAQKRSDIARARARALADTQLWYTREEEALRRHFAQLEVIAVAGATRMIQSTVRAIQSVGRGVLYQGGGLLGSLVGSTTGTGGNTGSRVTGQPIDQWLRGRTPGGYRAHGGLDVVNRPTTFTAGEAGAEIAAFIPLSNNRNINHSFDKLPIDFGGLPGGMDTGQVETIVYSAMVELARTLSTPRR